MPPRTAARPSLLSLPVPFPALRRACYTWLQVMMTCGLGLIARLLSPAPRWRCCLPDPRDGGTESFWNNVERPRAANARLPLCLQPRNGRGAGRVPWAVSQRVSWGSRRAPSRTRDRFTGHNSHNSQAAPDQRAAEQTTKTKVGVWRRRVLRGMAWKVFGTRRD